MKPLYTFTVGEGADETKIAVAKPTHAQIEDAEFIYGQYFSKLLQEGFMSRAMMNKKFNDIGGVFSDKTNDELVDAVEQLVETQRIIQFYHGAAENGLDDEQKAQLKQAEDTYQVLQKQIIENDMQLQQMFNQSADSKAEKHMMKWLTLNCSYYYEKVVSKDSGKPVEESFLIFSGADFEEKQKEFNLLLEEIEDEDDEILTGRKKMTVEALPTVNKVLSIWYNKFGTDQETIETAIEKYFPEEEEVETKEEETEAEEAETEKEEKKETSKKKPSKKKAAKKD